MKKLRSYLSLMVFSAFVIVPTALIYWLYPKIITDGLYTGLMAFVVGLFAIWLYLRKQIDHKKDAASIILLEIQNAERILPQIKDGLRSSTLTNKFLLPTDSWDKYKYLFVRDFDSLEWDSITSFYNNCKLYDEAVSYNNTFFQKNEEQVRVNMFRIQSDIIRNELNDFDKETTKGNRDDAVKTAFDKAVQFQNDYISKAALLLYSPNKPVGDAKRYIEDILLNMSQTSVGDKLKNMSGLKGY